MIKNPDMLMKYIEDEILDFMGCTMFECKVLLNQQDNHDKIYVPLLCRKKDAPAESAYFIIGVYGKNGGVKLKNDLKGKELTLADADAEFVKLSQSKQKKAKGYEYDLESTILLKTHYSRKAHYSLAVNNWSKEEALNVVEGLLDAM